MKFNWPVFWATFAGTFLGNFLHGLLTKNEMEAEVDLTAIEECEL